MTRAMMTCLAVCAYVAVVGVACGYYMERQARQRKQAEKEYIRWYAKMMEERCGHGDINSDCNKQHV